MGEQFSENPRGYAIASDTNIQVLKHTEVPYVRSDTEDPFLASARSALGAFGADYEIASLQKIFRTNNLGENIPSPFKRMLSLVKMGVHVCLIEDTGQQTLDDLRDPEILEVYTRAREPYPSHHENYAWYHFEAERIGQFLEFTDKEQRDHLAGFANAPGGWQVIHLFVAAGALVQMFVEGDVLFPTNHRQPGRPASLLVTGLAQEFASASEQPETPSVVSSGVIAHCAYQHENNNIKDLYIPWEQLETAHAAYDPQRRRILALQNAGQILHLPAGWEAFEELYGRGSSQRIPLKQRSWPRPQQQLTEKLYQTTEDMDTLSLKWAPHQKSYSDRCVPAALEGATKGTLLGNLKHQLTRQFFEKISDYQPGLGAACGPALEPLMDLGFAIRWIANLGSSMSDLATREGYLANLRKNYEGEALEKQLAMLNERRLQRQIQMFGRYATNQKLRYEDRVASFEDIVKMLDEGFVIITVDGGKLFPRSEQLHTPNPHVVLAIGSGTAPQPDTGRSVRGLVIQNSDGIYGNIPNQFVTEEQLYIAREANSKGMSVIGIKGSVTAGPSRVPPDLSYTNWPLSPLERHQLDLYTLRSELEKAERPNFCTFLDAQEGSSCDSA